MDKIFVQNASLIEDMTHTPDYDRIVENRDRVLAAKALDLFDVDFGPQTKTLAKAALKQFDGFSDWTREHSERVGKEAKTFALFLGAGERAATNFEMAASLHDLGKLCVDEKLLNTDKPLKEGPGLEEIRSHAKRGGPKVRALLKGADDRFVDLAVRIAETHHEKFGGNGYPEKLSGEAIPLPGRVVSLCDVFDAMNYARPHQREFSAGEILCAMAGGKDRFKGSFDERLMKPFIRMKLEENEKKRAALKPGEKLPLRDEISPVQKKSLVAFVDPNRDDLAMPAKIRVLRDKARI